MFDFSRLPTFVYSDVIGFPCTTSLHECKVLLLGATVCSFRRTYRQVPDNQRTGKVEGQGRHR